MALARWNPNRDMMSVRDEMSRVLNEAFGRGTPDESAWILRCLDASGGHL